MFELKITFCFKKSCERKYINTLIISIYLFFLLGFVINASGQYIDGPANIRNKPNGDKLFSINNLVSIKLDDETQNDWRKITLHCYVNQNQLIDKKIIKSNSVLLNSQGDSIGLTFLQFQLSENFDDNSRNYNQLEKIEIEIDGYTFKNNIKEKLSLNEIKSTRISYADSCVDSYVTYKDEDYDITLIHSCNMYERMIIINDQYVEAFIKEIQDITRNSSMEGDNSKILLEIHTDYRTDNPKIRKFTINADDIDIRGRIIDATTYGCCDSENSNAVFNISTFEKLMDYETQLYTIRFLKSTFENYIGFQTSRYENNDGKLLLGTLTFTDGIRIINKVNFFTLDKQKYNNISGYLPDMQFIALNQKDKVEQNGNLIELSINLENTSSEFQFMIHFLDDNRRKIYSHKLEFINGFINGKSEIEFDINID